MTPLLGGNTQVDMFLGTEKIGHIKRNEIVINPPVHRLYAGDAKFNKLGDMVVKRLNAYFKKYDVHLHVYRRKVAYFAKELNTGLVWKLDGTLKLSYIDGVEYRDK